MIEVAVKGQCKPRGYGLNLPCTRLRACGEYESTGIPVKVMTTI